MENLNKENFFNRIQEQYPKSMEKFCVWIDEWKVKNNWNNLFNAGIVTNSDEILADSKTTIAPKFHDPPVEMQMGIIMIFFGEQSGKIKETEILESAMEMAVEEFNYLEEQLDYKDETDQASMENNNETEQ